MSSEPSNLVRIDDAKPHYLEHFCVQNKELAEANIGCLASVVIQTNFSEMEIKAFDGIERVIFQHIFHIHINF